MITIVEQGYGGQVSKTFDDRLAVIAYLLSNEPIVAGDTRQTIADRNRAFRKSVAMLVAERVAMLQPG